MGNKVEDFWRDTLYFMLEICVQEKSSEPVSEFEDGYRSGLLSLMKIISTQAEAFEVDLSDVKVDGLNLKDWLGGY